MADLFQEMVSLGRVAADQAGVVVFHDHAIDENCLGRNLLRLFGSLRGIALLCLAF